MEERGKRREEGRLRGMGDEVGGVRPVLTPPGALPPHPPPLLVCVYVCMCVLCVLVVIVVPTEPGKKKETVHHKSQDTLSHPHPSISSPF